MRRLKSFFLLVIISLSVELSAQTTHVAFLYDNCGNRVQRYVILVPENKSALVDDVLSQPMDAKVEALEFKVYPNPTRGILRIEMSSLAIDSKVDVKIFNIPGDLVLQKHNLSISDEIDIIALQDGAYVFKISILGKVYSGKIVKNTE